MNGLTPERRAEMRDCLSREPNLEAVYWPVGGVTLSALLDTTDERDRLVEAVEALTALLDEESAENKKLRALSHDQAERLKELDRIQQEKRAEQVKRIKAEHLRIRVQGKSYCAVDGMNWPCLSIRNLSEEIVPSQPCPLPVGDRPYWMSADQWDPCACILLKDHDGPCECSHTVKEN